MTPVLPEMVPWLSLLVRREASFWPIAVTWSSLAAGLMGMVAVGAFVHQNQYGVWQVFSGVLRVVVISLLTYGIVRGQVKGFDNRVRWGVSRGTIAAAFIAVFFVASEAAQQFFGETLGSTYLGIAAAGALVFAIAPLQRVAERLAEKAIPAQAGPEGAHPNARAYRHAVLAAIAAGGLTPEAEAHLADLGEALGLGAGEALRLRRAVEQEVAAQ